jgi:hypothetical protein
MITKFASGKLSLLCLLALLAIPACSGIGNGEGYPGVSSPTQPTLMEGIYYWIDPAYRCRPDGSSALLPSYRNAVRVSGKTLVLLGDRCRPTSVPISPTEPIEAWNAEGILGYREGIYERKDIPPPYTSMLPAPYLEAWCHEAREGGAEVSMRAHTSDGPRQARLLMDGKTRTLTATKEEDGKVRRYTADGFHLSVSLPSGEAVPLGYNGRLSVSSGGDAHPREVEVSCRLLPQ